MRPPRRGRHRREDGERASGRTWREDKAKDIRGQGFKVTGDDIVTPPPEPGAHRRKRRRNG